MDARPETAERAATADASEADLRYAWRALSVVTSAAFFTSLNFSSLTIALPDIVRHFDASSVEASWIVVVFGLVATCATLACGRAADAVDRRTLYLGAFALFTAASLLAGFAPTARALIALQGLQALGEAMLMANSAVIVASVFPRALVGRALGIYLAGFSVAALAGPTVGGVIATALGWQWVFWVNVPVGLACLAWGAATLRPMPAPAGRVALDVRGNLLLIAGLGGFVVALSSVGSAGWGSASVRFGLLASVVFLPLFVWAQLRTADPILDVRALARRAFALVLGAWALHSIATSAVVVLSALYLQSVQGVSAVRAGVLVLPLAAANVVAAASVGALTSRFAPRVVSAIGASTSTAGLTVLVVATSTGAPLALLTLGLVLVGVGSGFFQPANAAATLEAADSTLLGRTNATRITVQNIAFTSGLALSLTLVAATLPGELKRAVFDGEADSLRDAARDQLGGGFALALGVTALIALAAVLVSLRTGPPGRARETQAA